MIATLPGLTGLKVRTTEFRSTFPENTASSVRSELPGDSGICSTFRICNGQTGRKISSIPMNAITEHNRAGAEPRAAYWRSSDTANAGPAAAGMRAVALCVVSLLALGGCGNPQPYVTEQRLRRGLVIVLPGIEGRSPFNEEICRGLDRGGIDWAIELCDWTIHVPLGFLINLRAEQRNRAEAGRIADRIVRYQQNYPGRRVVLIGQSGGGAIAAWICEAMPWGRKIDGAIMLAAALSPDYPLTGALRNCRRGIINFHSSRDVVLLWLGTTVYGTMDGQHRSSAGRNGFTVPSPRDRPREYQKLVQVPWTYEMAQAGNIGTHLSSGDATFVAAYIAPLVGMPRWTEDELGAVLHPAIHAATQPATRAATSPATRPAPPASRPATKPASRPEASPARRAGQV